MLQLLPTEPVSKEVANSDTSPTAVPTTSSLGSLTPAVGSMMGSGRTPSSDGKAFFTPSVSAMTENPPVAAASKTHATMTAKNNFFIRLLCARVTFLRSYQSFIPSVFAVFGETS